MAAGGWRLAAPHFTGDLIQDSRIQGFKISEEPNGCLWPDAKSQRPDLITPTYFRYYAPICAAIPRIAQRFHALCSDSTHCAAIPRIAQRFHASRSDSPHRAAIPRIAQRFHASHSDSTHCAAILRIAQRFHASRSDSTHRAAITRIVQQFSASRSDSPLFIIFALSTKNLYHGCSIWENLVGPTMASSPIACG